METKQENIEEIKIHNELVGNQQKVIFKDLLKEYPNCGLPEACLLDQLADISYSIATENNGHSKLETILETAHKLYDS